MIEEWKLIVDRIIGKQEEGCFKQYVSNFGRIRSDRVYRYQENSSTIVKLFENGRGYYVFSFYRDAQRRTNGLVHRLVAEYFVPGYFEGAYVNHLDGNKLNNRADNLEWCTLQDNAKHAQITGLLPKGEQKSNSKLTAETVRQIRTKYASGDFSQQALATEYKVSRHTIRFALSGESWSHVK